MNSDLYFSFFMFTADLRPTHGAYAETIAAHMNALAAFGYAGFDLPIAPVDVDGDRAKTLKAYEALKQALDAGGPTGVRFTTNVAATRIFDPASDDPGVRAAALAYLKSRVDIAAALGGEIMAGPIVFPYGVFPRRDRQTLWSDELQDWVLTRLHHVRPVLEALGDYAKTQGVKVAIEPVDHWETASPNLVSDVMHVLEPVQQRQIGVCIDSAHVMLGSDGPSAFRTQVDAVAADERLHYVHLSAPDRGAIDDSWIDWPRVLGPILPHYRGPLLIEVFNAIPAFLDGLRLTRRKFWIPGEDKPRPGRPSAYDVARDAATTVRAEVERLAISQAHSARKG